MFTKIHNQNNRPVGATFRKDAVDTPLTGAANTDMKLIPLSKNGKHKGKYFAMVDDLDYDELAKYKWSALVIHKHNITYAWRMHHDNSGRKIAMLMHRQITGAQKGQIVDHADHNGLNCQRANLRFATWSQNGANRKSSRRSASKYLGVSFLKCEKKWRAQIRINGKNKTIGRYNCEEDAAIAYDFFAMCLHGEFANLNFK